MFATRFVRCCLALAVLFCWPLAARAQTLTITNGVQKYASLTGTTVNMSGKCELWVTASATPLSGCTVNLNSVDAWLFLPGVKPSVVVASYLGQIIISGASAVADSNCRVVQYGQNGAVVIPQPSSFQPLTVFTSPEFAGTATSYSQWTYYTGTAITNISSFKLKRGYQAVLAQSANGANYSKCYTAQDGDLEIGVLPATLDKQVQFIYVTPWRWTSKKGIAGNPPYSWLNVNWWYDWNIDSSSSRDLEYLAIRQERWWPDLGQNWQSLGVNTVMGYNEPDNPVQANIAVGDALWSWPDLLAPGQRVGSPACTDGGVSSWLLPFMSQVSTSQANEDNAAGMRVDFIAQHYYQAADPSSPSACASQMYNFLLNIWNNTHKPIWVTEWNNGANWTDGSPYPAPTYAQQQADIAAMTQMLETTPFVERYALYNWVEDTRSLVTSSNTVTAAGVTYSNLVSNLSYSQAMPDNGTRGIAEFLFASNLWDTAGYYNNGLAVGAPNFTTGHNSQATAIALDGTNSYVQLPANIANGGAFTFAAWVYWNGGNQWQRIFDFGAVSTTQGGTPSQYMFLTPDSGNTTLRFAINTGSGEQIVERSGALASGSWQHVAITLNGTYALLYVNGTQVASNSVTYTPSAFSPVKNYLGKSQFSSDPLFSGNLDGVEIADYAMTAAQISVLYNSAQNPSFISGVWTNNASGNWGTSNNWSGGVVANGTSRIADFSTINITANQTVTLDSARTIGGLRFGDTTGSQNWFLSGANPLTLDGGGANAALIAVNQNSATISTPLSGNSGFTKSGNGTLTLAAANTYSGGTTVNAGTVILSGAGTLGSSGNALTVNGGTLNLGAQTPTVGAVTISGGTIQNGTLTGASYAATETTSATVSAALAGSAALTHTGSGILTLSGTNTFTGALTVGAGGTVILSGNNNARPANANNLTVVSGTLQLQANATNTVSGTSTALSHEQTANGPLNLNNGATVQLRSDSNVTFAGANNLGGVGSATITFDVNQLTAAGANNTLTFAPLGFNTFNTTINVTGGHGDTLALGPIITGFGAPLTLNANSVNLTINGSITSVTTLTFGGGFNSLVSGVIANGTTTTTLNNSGAGTLTLSATNTYTGSTTISAGTLVVGGAGKLGGGSYAGNITNNSALTYSSSATQTLSGVISGSGTLNRNGSGTLTLSGNESFTGALTVAAGGTVVLSGNNSARPSNANNLTIVSGTLQLQANAGNIVSGISYALSPEETANGPLNPNSGSTIQLRSDSNVTFAGANSLGGAGNATITIDVNQLTAAGANNTFTFAPGGFNTFNTTLNVTGGHGDTLALVAINALSGSLAFNANSANVTINGIANISPLTFGGGFNSAVTGVISGGALSKSGAGTLTLTAANTYTGATTVSGGTLVVNGNNSAANGAVTVTSATLSGTGTIGGATTLQPAAILYAGINGVGTLAFKNNLTLNPTSTNLFVVTTLGGASNRVAVTSGTLSPNSSIVEINTGGDPGLGAGTNVLFTYSSEAGSFNLTPQFVTPQTGLATNASIMDTGSQIELVVPNLASAPSLSGLQFMASPVISGTSLTISATNTGAGTVYLLTSTNVAAAISTWTPIWTNVLPGNGSFTTNLPNAVNPALNQQFYLLSNTNN